MTKAHGLAHVTLTVSDVTKTKAFYETLFATPLPMDNPHSFSLLNVGIPCWFVQWEKNTPDRFNEKRVGLDHIAFKLETLAELEKITAKLTEMGVPTAGLERFAGIYPYVCFRDPDNIQTEFFIPKQL